MLFGFIPSVAEAVKFKEEKDEAVKSVKSLEKQIESLKDELKYERKVAREELELEKRDHARIIDELEHKLDVLTKRHEEEVETLKKRNATVVADLEKRADKAETDADARVADELELEEATVRFELESEFIARERAIRDELTEARVEAAEANGTAKERLTVIKSLESQLGDYREFVKFVLTKLPDVDLTKFNINVDVAPAEVTVVSGGNKGGGEEKKK